MAKSVKQAVPSKALLKRLGRRRDKMASHVRDLIARGRGTEADGWEFRLIELRHVIRMVRRSNPSHHAPPLGGGSVNGVVQPPNQI